MLSLRILTQTISNSIGLMSPVVDEIARKINLLSFFRLLGLLFLHQKAPGRIREIPVLPGRGRCGQKDIVSQDLLG